MREPPLILPGWPAMLFNKNDLRLHKANWKEVTDNADAALRDALVGVLRDSSIEVIDNTEEGQRMLDEANETVNMQAKRRALETASVTSKEEHQPTVVSSANGTKILKILTKQFKNLKIHLLSQKHL